MTLIRTWLYFLRHLLVLLKATSVSGVFFIVMRINNADNDELLKCSLASTWRSSDRFICLCVFTTCSDFIFLVSDSLKSSRMQRGIASGRRHDITTRYNPDDGSSTVAYRFAANQVVIDPQIAADLRPSADGFAVRTSLVLGLAVAVLKILNVIRDEAAHACTRSINSKLFTGWQRRCGLSLPAPRQIVAVK